MKSEQRKSAPIEMQVDHWNTWNAWAREASVGHVSLEQAIVVEQWIAALGPADLDILDAGCGAGWLSNRLSVYGHVMGVDLANEVLVRAEERYPQVSFKSGDIINMDFGDRKFDAIVSLEVLAHVEDQGVFIDRLAGLLRPGGILVLATQNRPQLERNNIPPPGAGQIRQWVDRHELRRLLSDRFEIEKLISITPQFNRGPLRYLNSHRLRGWLESSRLGFLNAIIKNAQERAFWGWTLMAQARKKD